MHLSIPAAIALLSFGLACPASASTLTVSESGIFSSVTPTTAYSIANGTFLYSFTVDSSPALNSYVAGYYFYPVISNFQYDLNGASVSLGTVTAGFNNGSSVGLFNLCFGTGCTGEVEVYGAQAYSGSEASPTILTGSYLPTQVEVFGPGFVGFLASTSNVNITAAPVALTPEPSSLALLGTGLLGIMAVLKRRPS